MIKYAPIKVVQCKAFFHQPVGYNRGGTGFTFSDINKAHRYIEQNNGLSFECGCKFDIKEVETQ